MNMAFYFSKLEVEAEQIGEDSPWKFPDLGDDMHCRFVACLEGQSWIQ